MEDFNNLPQPSHTDDEEDFGNLDYKTYEGVNLHDMDYGNEAYGNDDLDGDEEGEIQES